MRLKRVLLSLTMIGAAWGAPGGADSLDYLNMDLEELMDIQVVSASRSEQSLSELAVPVSVLTKEDIRNSGLTTLPELLALMPGVDVRRTDRTHYIVGVRGQMSMYSDRTLVLINGRDALNPTVGAPDWLTLPVLIDDIERIEVLRGLGGGVWGANAYTGVINIITQDPTEIEGTASSFKVSDFGDTYTQLQTGGECRGLAWRASGGYEDLQDSDKAGAGRPVSAYPAIIAAMGPARDFARVWRFDSEFTRTIREATDLSFGAAHTSLERGDREFITQFPQQDGLASLTRTFGKIDHRFDDETKGYVQFFGNYSVTHSPEMLKRYTYYENDLEGQLQSLRCEGHAITVGGNLRWTHMDHENGGLPGELMYGQDDYDEYWAGAYLVDRYEVTSRLAVEGQGRIDHYSESGTDWSGRLAGLYALDPDKKHVVRLGAARAFRAPGLLLRESTVTAMGGLFNIVANPLDLTNETTYSLEAGYVGQFSGGLIVRMDGYYQRMDHLLGAVTQTTFVPPATVISNTTLANLDGANAYGAECEISYRKGRTQCAGWYAYNELSTDQSTMAIRAFFPARHKAGIRCLRNLYEGGSLQTNYVFNNANFVNASGNPAAPARVSNRLDMTFTHRFKEKHGELQLGVTDVLNKTTPEVFELSSFTSFETPGRMFFARLRCGLGHSQDTQAR